MKYWDSLLQHIRRRYRRRRWLSLGALCFAASLILLFSWYDLSLFERQNEPNITVSTALMTASFHDLEGTTVDVPDYGEGVSDNSYIGLDEHDVLSLFEGPPGEANVIRSFFQINVKYLESSLPPEIVEQLYKGIHVTNIYEYNSVLSTFSDYAVHLSEEVMQQMY